jgi:tripartite-type tricarboxylate transporter receptor subunit TctC
MKSSIALFVLIVALTAAHPTWSQYPARPIRVIVPLAAGGPADLTARAVAEPLSRALGQPVIVENRPGADGAIAAEAVRNSPPDGYTLLWGTTGAMVGVPLLHKNPPYDPITGFVPVSLIGRATLFIFEHPEVPAKSLAEFVEYARANPGKVSYAHSVLTEAVAAAQLSSAAGITMVRVPYKGGTSLIPDLIAGRVQIGFMPASTGLPHVKQGRLRALAVLLPRRSLAAPDVPTLAEAGYPNVLTTSWVAVFGPAGMPAEVVERLSREINFALDQPEVRAQFEKQAFQGEGSTPQALTAFLEKELDAWRQVVRETGITLE